MRHGAVVAARNGIPSQATRQRIRGIRLWRVSEEVPRELVEDDHRGQQRRAARARPRDRGGPQVRIRHASLLASAPDDLPPRLRWRGAARFPIVRGPTIYGHERSAGDSRNPSQIMELEVVARDGIEPSTRGFSVRWRAEFGTSKLKTGNRFSTGRPNRPARPSLFRTPGASSYRTAPKLKKRKGGGASRPNSDRTAYPAVKRHFSVYDDA